ncbi:Hypothetical protein SRAE_X000133000 [Strongyloides ratti]|uniref:aECM cysteine-cradle domain-containing protein n=1 Tax=Strongyloides ratti TaxID=34506 RepID=A0A090KPV1_STRRB|nr:Hypothetical protein SRAE_X000133000 [Strongyloides ratti]CEF59583.1 Hypothetical protein SRAE_X000133000 [Strongyloides ratti]
MLNELKNYKKVRKFKCIEVIEFIDEDTGEVVDEEIIRKVKPKILISKNKNNIVNYMKNIVSKKAFTKPTENIFPTSTERSEIKIFNKKHPKHLSNEYFTVKDNLALEKLIGKKYSEGTSDNKNENKEIIYKKSNYLKNKYSNYEDFYNRRIYKTNHVSKSIEDDKKINNLNEIVIPVASHSKNYTDSNLISSKSIDKNNNTIIEDKKLINKTYDIPESPPYIPQRPEQSYYSEYYQKEKKYNHDKNLNTRVYAKSNYKKITEDGVIEKNIIFTTLKPIITSSNFFMNQAPLNFPKQYNTTNLKNVTNNEEQSSKNNLIMTKENCQKMNYFSKTFGIKDVQKWVRNNCFFVQFYLPQATCQDIYMFVDSCFKKFFLK